MMELIDHVEKFSLYPVNLALHNYIDFVELESIDELSKECMLTKGLFGCPHLFST
jgi:hypothetical protein